MDALTIPLEIAAACALLVVLVSTYLGVRRVWLSRQRGSFDLAVRYPGRRWTVGVARYGSTSLDWFRVFHLSLRPATVFERRRLVILRRRDPGRAEHTLLADLVIVRARYDDVDVDLALSEQAYFGLASWTEAAPPGAFDRLAR